MGLLPSTTIREETDFKKRASEDNPLRSYYLDVQSPQSEILRQAIVFPERESRVANADDPTL